mmetsp:Transcript_22852/g.65966  ORF Transcript_22852/g.65966 Transcript_22852/m.65966 type:complete len:375 (+) Transcript_22852:45-1169(+)
MAESPRKRQKSEAAAEPSVVVLEHADLVAGLDLSAQIEAAYGPGGLGMLWVRGVPGLVEARQALLPLARKLALLPEAALQKYENEKAYYCLGWARGREKFKGKPDIAKGSFYGNPIFDDPSGGDESVRAAFPFVAPNVWPSEVPELEGAFKSLGRIVYEAAKPIVQQIDKLVARVHPGHTTALFDRTFTESRLVVSRLLHYYGVGDSDGVDDWCGWHNDNSTISGLVPAMWLDEATGLPVAAPSGAGLLVEGRNGDMVHIVAPGEDCLGFQIGESAQILSGGVVHATPHAVKAFAARRGEPKVSRETFACFIEPQWDGMLAPPAGVPFQAIFKGREESTRIPPLRMRLKEVPMSFGDFLGQSSAIYYEHNNPSN